MEYSEPQAYLDSQGSSKANRAVVMQTIGRAADRKTLKICSTVLSPEKYSVYQWQTYRVEWRSNGVQYFVGDDLVASHQDIYLEKHMAFHNWVDNRNYTNKKIKEANFPLTKDKANYIRSFLVESAAASGLPKPAKGKSSECVAFTEGKILEEILKALAKDYI